MTTCEKCRVTVRGDQTRCPLCQGRLSGAPDGAVYPHIPTVYRQYETLFRLLILGTVAVIVACGAVNLALPGGGPWSLLVVLGAGCFWIALAIALRSLHNIPHTITNQAAVVSVLSILWDAFTGWHGWSVDYVMPIACALAMTVMATVAQVLRMPAEDYLVCFAVDALFGVVPLILYLTGALGQVLPSLICIAISVLSLAAIIVFEGKNIRLEIAKRFHL